MNLNNDFSLIEAPEQGHQIFAFNREEKFIYPLRPGEQLDDENDLKLTVLGPTRKQILKLHEEWDKEVDKIRKAEEKKRAEAAAYLDDSVY